MWFDAPLAIGGVTEVGLVLHGGTYATYPDRNVTFELVVRNVGGVRRLKLARFDWRSIKGTHTNRVGPPGLKGKRVPETHLHEFELNWLAAENRMRGGNLPVARPIVENPQTFEQVREFVGKSFRINNIELVTPPEWEYNLFDGNAK